jgi:hypothetical protein
VKKTEIGRAYSTYGSRGEVHTGFFFGGGLWKGDDLEGPDVGGRILLKFVFKKWVGDTIWIDLDRSGSGQGQVAWWCECGNEPS